MSDTTDTKLTDTTQVVEDAKDHVVDKTNSQSSTEPKTTEPISQEKQREEHQPQEQQEHNLSTKAKDDVHNSEAVKTSEEVQPNADHTTVNNKNDSNKEDGKECVPTDDIAVIIEPHNKGLVSATITDMNSNKTIVTGKSSAETVQTNDKAEHLSQTEPVNTVVNTTEEMQKEVNEEEEEQKQEKDRKSETEKQQQEVDRADKNTISENTNANNIVSEQHNEDATTSSTITNSTSPSEKQKTEKLPEKQNETKEKEEKKEEEEQLKEQTQEKQHHHNLQEYNETKLNANAKSFIPSLTTSPQLGASDLHLNFHNNNNNNNSFQLNRSHSGNTHTMSAPPTPMSSSLRHGHVGVTQIPLPRHARQKSPELHSTITENTTHESTHHKPQTTENDEKTELTNLSTGMTHINTHLEQQQQPTATNISNNNTNNNNNNNINTLHTITPQPFTLLTIHGLQAEHHQQQQLPPPPPPPPAPLLPENNNNNNNNNNNKNMIVSPSGLPVMVSNMPGSSLAMSNTAAQSYPMLNPYVTALPSNTMNNVVNGQPSMQSAVSNNNNINNPSVITSTNNNETGKIAFPPPIITGRPPSSSLPASSSSAATGAAVLPSPVPPISQISSSSSSLPNANTTSLNYISLPQGDLLAPFAKAIPTLQSVMSTVQPFNNNNNNNNNTNNALPPPPPPPHNPSLANLPPASTSSSSVLQSQLPVSLQQQQQQQHYTNVTQSLPTQIIPATNTNEYINQAMFMPFSAMNTISLQNYTPIPTSTQTNASFQNMQNVNPQTMLSTTALPLPAFLTPITTNTNMNTLPLPPQPLMPNNVNVNMNAPTSLPLFTSDVHHSTSQHLAQPSASVSTSSDPRLHTSQTTFTTPSNSMQPTFTHPLIGSQINYLPPQQQTQAQTQGQNVNTTSFILSPQSKQMLTTTPATNATTTTPLSQNNLQQQQQQQQQIQQTFNNVLFPNNTMTWLGQPSSSSFTPINNNNNNNNNNYNNYNNYNNNKNLSVANATSFVQIGNTTQSNNTNNINNNTNNTALPSSSAIPLAMSMSLPTLSHAFFTTTNTSTNTNSTGVALPNPSVPSQEAIISPPMALPFELNATNSNLNNNAINANIGGTNLAHPSQSLTSLLSSTSPPNANYSVASLPFPASLPPPPPLPSSSPQQNLPAHPSMPLSAASTSLHTHPSLPITNTLIPKVSVGNASLAALQSKEPPKFSCILLSGLPSTGKTTLGRELVQMLRADGKEWEFFSGADCLKESYTKRAAWETTKEIFDALNMKLDELQAKQKDNPHPLKGLVIDKNCKGIEDIYYLNTLLKSKHIPFVGIIGMEVDNDEILLQRMGGDEELREKLKYHRAIHTRIVNLAKASGMYRCVDAGKSKDEVLHTLRTNALGCCAQPPNRALRIPQHYEDVSSAQFVDDVMEFASVMQKLHECVNPRNPQFPSTNDFIPFTLRDMSDKTRIGKLKSHYGVRAKLLGNRFLLMYTSYQDSFKFYLIPLHLRAVLELPLSA